MTPKTVSPRSRSTDPKSSTRSTTACGREIRAAVERAEADDDVHVIVVRGAGKPTIARVHGAAVADGSDIALCCDFLIMPRKRAIPRTRVGRADAGDVGLSAGAAARRADDDDGDLIDGREAARIGLAPEAVPEVDLDPAVERRAGRLRGVPRNQLMVTKTVVNQAYDNMGLNNTQMFATLFDGVARHSPEGRWFHERAQEVGFKQAVAERDSGDPIASQVSRRRDRIDGTGGTGGTDRNAPSSRCVTGDGPVRTITIDYRDL